MQTTQHTLGKVLLHPACTTNPDAVRAVQQATGQLVVLNGGKPQLRHSRPTFWFASGRSEYLSNDLKDRRFALAAEQDSGPFGGDAA